MKSELKGRPHLKKAKEFQLSDLASGTRPSVISFSQEGGAAAAKPLLRRSSEAPQKVSDALGINLNYSRKEDAKKTMEESFRVGSPQAELLAAKRKRGDYHRYESR